MSALSLRLHYFAREWLTGFVGLLPNDVISCRLRATVHRWFGVQVEPGVLIYRNVLLIGKVSIGQGSSISNNSCLSGASAGIRIGRDVMIAPGCCLVAFSHGTRLGAGPMRSQPLEEAPVVIGDDVWIGANCTITAGVTIGPGAVVAANSVVVHDVPALHVVGGVPAKTLKVRSNS